MLKVFLRQVCACANSRIPWQINVLETADVSRATHSCMLCATVPQYKLEGYSANAKSTLAKAGYTLQIDMNARHCNHCEQRERAPTRILVFVLCVCVCLCAFSLL